jgi:hypothetical protein
LRKHGRLLAIAGGCSLVFAVIIGGTIRGCRTSSRTENLEGRVGRIESVLGMGSETGDAAVAARPLLHHPDAGGTASAIDDRRAACAVAKIEAYEAWQDAVAKAKTNAQAAEAQCNDMREKKKQACYYAAFAGVRATQAARDSVIKGGATAHEVVKNMKDDPKNEGIAHARTASAAAWAACDDENEL